MSEIVLLTGLPTPLARRLALELLARDTTRIFAVVRAKFIEPARAFVAGLPEAMRPRVELLEGDAAAMDLGLSGAEFRALAREVTVVHHAAQATYVGVEPAVAETMNVRATREALEVARAMTKLRAFVHHSTAYVSGDRRGLVLESELDRGQKPRNVVEETKLAAERIVRAARARVPVVVVRPSTIVGDAESGEVDRFDGLYLLLLLLLTSPAEIALPLPTHGNALLHLVPIDYVARASVALGRDPRAIGQTFHLVDPEPLTLRRTFDLIARSSGRQLPRGYIPANVTKALLRAPGLERFVKSPRAFLDQLATPVRYSTHNTEAMLAGSGIVAPPFETYVNAMVGYVRQRLNEQRRRRDALDSADPLDDPLG